MLFQFFVFKIKPHYIKFLICIIFKISLILSYKIYNNFCHFLGIKESGWVDSSFVKEL